MATRRPLFVLASAADKFGPRTGSICIDRGEGGSSTICIDTPTLLTTTSRGLVPHLSRDNVQLTEVIQVIQLPFESFIDRNPPVPTLVGGAHPLHTFFGYSADRHAIALTLRDPSDGRKMPPNGNDFVSVHCARGVRKVNTAAWKTYVQQCKPDLVVALSDTPFTPPPHSQKRLTKSIERSIKWLADILRIETDLPALRPQHVLVHLAGGTDPHARGEFADRLTEPIEEKDSAGLSPFNTLDEGVAGYSFDLLPLHASFAAEASHAAGTPSVTGDSRHTSYGHRTSSESSARLAELLQASLQPLPGNKLRILNSPSSPHEILRLVRDVGIDVIDGHWAQHAADIGVALDFCFPVRTAPSTENCPGPRLRKDGKMDLGHNLFDTLYRSDHSRLASLFIDGASAQQVEALIPVCPCGACSPHSPDSRLSHSAVDVQAWQDSQHPRPLSALQPPFARSYIHHLLHTHEMSSHSLLAMHNLHVLTAFLNGIRAVLSREGSSVDEFAKEVDKFEQTYDEEMLLWDETQKMWLEVERARGKGRLSREKEKEK